MTREEAIRVLFAIKDELMERHFSYKDHPSMPITAIDMAIEALSADAEWIPVSERLPSAEDCPMDCMVTRRSKYVGNYTDMAVAEANGTWTHEDWKAITIDGNATCISTRDADIIAWMPLPKPYREDGEA